MVRTPGLEPGWPLSRGAEPSRLSPSRGGRAHNAICPSWYRSTLRPIGMGTSWNYAGVMRDGVIKNHSLLLRCAFLQMLDVATTLLFLARGVAEANPLVKWSISITHGNLWGLLAVKSLACVLVAVTVSSGRIRVVETMNRFFTFLATWNLMALAVSFKVH